MIKKILRKGNQGWTFSLFNLAFVKIVDKWQIINHDLFNREKAVYDILIKNKCDWIPKIYYTNNYDTFIFEYVGEPINNQNIPNNYKLQINKIINDLNILNIKHNDICYYMHPARSKCLNPNKIEILVKNNKLYLVDFAWASLGEDRSIGTNTIKNIDKELGYKGDNQWNKDINVIYYLDEIYNNRKRK